jgi:hypothetical protein
MPRQQAFACICIHPWFDKRSLCCVRLAIAIFVQAKDLTGELGYYPRPYERRLEMENGSANFFTPRLWLFTRWPVRSLLRAHHYRSRIAKGMKEGAQRYPPACVACGVGRCAKRDAAPKTRCSCRRTRMKRLFFCAVRECTKKRELRREDWLAGVPNNGSFLRFALT